MCLLYLVSFLFSLWFTLCQCCCNWVVFQLVSCGLSLFLVFGFTVAVVFYIKLPFWNSKILNFFFLDCIVSRSCVGRLFSTILCLLNTRVFVGLYFICCGSLFFVLLLVSFLIIFYFLILTLLLWCCGAWKTF